MTRLKLKCKHCGTRIKDPRSQYQQYCDKCYNLNKQNGGEISKMAAKKKSESVTKTTKTSLRNEREELAAKVVAFMKNDLAIPTGELLLTNHLVWLKLKKN